MDAMTYMDKMAAYGVRESNSIFDAAYTHEHVDYDEGDVRLNDPRLISIDRLRLLTERGYPYCYGTLRDGRHVRVYLGDTRLPRKNTKGFLIELAREQGVYAKRLGLLDEGNWSILW